MDAGKAWKSAWIAAAGIALVLASPGPAHATHVSCGALISADTALDSDLTDCAGNGIEITAPDVTVDLGGYTIDGTGGGVGVVTGTGISRAAVVNGTVREFQTNIRMGPGSGYVVRDVSLHDAHVGLLLLGVAGALVQRIAASGIDGSAIHAPGSSGVTAVHNHLFANNSGMGGIGFAGGLIAHNVVEDNAFYGFFFFQSTGTVFDRNRIRRNGTFGISLGEGSVDNLITRNHVARSGQDGIALSEDAGPNTLEHNRSDRNSDDGFDIAVAGTRLIGNSALRNGDLGFEAPLGAAFARHNRARHNTDERQCVGISC